MKTTSDLGRIDGEENVGLSEAHKVHFAWQCVLISSPTLLDGVRKYVEDNKTIIYVTEYSPSLYNLYILHRAVQGEPWSFVVVYRSEYRDEHSDLSSNADLGN